MTNSVDVDVEGIIDPCDNRVVEVGEIDEICDDVYSGR